MIKLPSTAKRICVHRVHVSCVDTINRQIMRDRRRRKGVAENVCGCRAIYEHDSVALCRSHAGQVALTLLLKGQNNGDEK